MKELRHFLPSKDLLLTFPQSIMFYLRTFQVEKAWPRLSLSSLTTSICSSITATLQKNMAVASLKDKLWRLFIASKVTRFLSIVLLAIQLWKKQDRNWATQKWLIQIESLFIAVTVTSLKSSAILSLFRFTVNFAVICLFSHQSPSKQTADFQNHFFPFSCWYQLFVCTPRSKRIHDQYACNFDGTIWIIATGDTIILMGLST